ncbi:MAG: NAD(P)/FAD-dependent oxidoreductase [Clostridiaceae bacterium]|nr:NAD(P)/FAD-dependent oxidoreductase [Clostridiaceae bacterium]
MIIVIGGGAAGMMAACAAAENGAKVTVIERNRLFGVKLNLTGKGRCNIANDCDISTLMKNITCNGKFLYSAFSTMSPDMVMEYFEHIGVPLKVERGNRVFPASDRAKDVTAALERELDRLQVRRIHGRVMDIKVEDGAVCAVCLDDGRIIGADAVILAAGGRSYPRTGSDGDGFRLARTLGHTITEPRPSLVPLVAEGELPAQLEGLSLKNICLTVMKETKEIFSDFGELLFTAVGISGPLALSASAHLGRSHTFPYRAFIDLKPALDPDTLDRRLLRDFTQQQNRDFSNALSGLLPAKLIPVVVMLSCIPPHTKVNSITREQRQALCSLLKAMPLTLTATGSWDEAVITAGGISVREVLPNTMESKLVKHLYISGEILDVDAYTGGFNLQIAWATGRCAGIAAAKGEQHA